MSCRTHRGSVPATPQWETICWIVGGSLQLPIGKPVAEFVSGELQFPIGKPIAVRVNGGLQFPSGKPTAVLVSGVITSYCHCQTVVIVFAR
jgi:hypothetical protein